MARTEVLVAGAGPTGLVLALWLAKQGVRLRIIDKGDGSPTTSRALVVHARTLELYRQLGIADEIIKLGHKLRAGNWWASGGYRARAPLGNVAIGVSPYPFMFILPQDIHERFLAQKLLDLFGISVERRTELVDFVDHGTHVSVKLTHYRENGVQEAEDCEALYVAGCDGAGSRVRHVLNIPFSGGTYEQLFYVADIEGSGKTLNGEGHVNIVPNDFLLVFGYGENGRARLAGRVEAERSKTLSENVTFEDVALHAVEALYIKVEKVNWFSTYHVHHRVADQFRKGRAFIVGDAGHIHSPAGGQGMNTGIGDAINLAWKLAAVIHNRAEDSILDSFDAERRPFAQMLVQTTDRAFSMVTANGPIVSFLRTYIVALLLPIVLWIPFVMPRLFRRMSQTNLNYRGTSLAEGQAGKVFGGDRLPWVAIENGPDNFEPLSTIAWQVHVYGTAKDELVKWCEAQDIALHPFPWSKVYGKKGLVRDAAYLIRPDSYIAVANVSGRAGEFDSYLQKRSIRDISTKR
ncbi:hypothetical protein AJ80_08915 [Polytolypa hystricis UAMH7299]|uniref:FAD-binding domain-containing protein n=1 Tax=Polytolypa hystricis (strain UAMH7299) TaxID=1447883 RepID=A0A2B7X020_POLH7|nr:hypothetical protein AJ80_08915 [Polytolypa hystricis UAMH7299]